MFLCLKMLIFKRFTFKSNLPSIEDFFVKKQNLFIVSNNIIKICYNRLNNSNQLFSSSQSFFSASSNLNNRNKKRWVIIIYDLLYALLNIYQGNFFLQVTNKNNKIYIFKVKIENRSKEMAVFLITRLIKYANLEYGLYKSWNIKLDCKTNVFNKIINFFKTKGILSKDQIRDNNVCISISSIKNYIKDKINFIDNGEKKNRQKMCMIKKHFHLHTMVLLIKTQTSVIILSNFGKFGLQHPNLVLMLSISGQRPFQKVYFNLTFVIKGFI